VTVFLLYQKTLTVYEGC